MRTELLTLFCLTISAVQCKVFILQTDFQRNVENHPVWHLSNSSDGKVVILQPQTYIALNFCLRQTSAIRLNDLRFSNGNNSEIVEVEVDGILMGLFRSPADPNHSWNRFMSTGAFPKIPVLSTGWHKLVIKFNGTADGLAVDHVELDIDDDRITRDILACELTCIPDHNFHVRENDMQTEASFIVQESYKTTCPEVDNINIPIFNPSVQEYEITAALPQYRSFSNWRAENTTGCPHLSPFYWSFNNLELTSNMRDVIDTPKAKLYFSNGQDPFSKLSLLMLISFRMEGKSKGMVDSEMGTILKVKFRHLTERVRLVFRYKGRHAGISDPVKKYVTPTEPQTEWTTRDFTWTEEDFNVIFVYISSNSSKPLLLEHMFLERRPWLPDEVQNVYKSDDAIVEVVFSDFWWLNPDSMTVHLTNGHSYTNVSYFRIYRPIAWNSGYAQVFVLYQDGNARLLPIPPEGVDWIPFGSSVIIGQTDPTVVRPYASITDALIDTENLVMNLRYKDGGHSKLTLVSSLTETRVVVSDIYMTRNPIFYPFTTFRSMYVAEGNSDVDHIKVNGIYTRHIMDNFNAIMGRNFVFHRKCMSRHLNLSPDIYIDIRRTSNMVQEVPLLRQESFQSLLQRIQDHRYRLWTPRLAYHRGF